MLSVTMATIMVAGVVIAMTIESSDNNASSDEVKRKHHFECAVMAAHFAVRHNLPDGYARASIEMRRHI